MPSDNHRTNVIHCVGAAVLTVSDTRTPQTDKSGALIREKLEQAGHRVVSQDIIPDESELVRSRILASCRNPEIHVVLLTGGTGISARDLTNEAVVSLLDKRLEGFGELFRALSFHEIGPAAMLSRAVAGVCQTTAVFSMPGSVAAVRLAMEKLILPELGHIAALLVEQQGP